MVHLLATFLVLKKQKSAVETEERETVTMSTRRHMQLLYSDDCCSTRGTDCEYFFVRLLFHYGCYQWKLFGQLFTNVVILCYLVICYLSVQSVLHADIEH